MWDCLWFWQLKDPLGLIMKSRSLCPCPRFLPQPYITINVCERAVKPDSTNQSIDIVLLYKYYVSHCLHTRVQPQDGRNLPFTGYTPFMLAVSNNNFDTVKYLLKQQVSLEERNQMGETALLLSTGYGSSPEICKLLVEAGADINQR